MIPTSSKTRVTFSSIFLHEMARRIEPMSAECDGDSSRDENLHASILILAAAAAAAKKKKKQFKKNIHNQRISSS